MVCVYFILGSTLVHSVASTSPDSSTLVLTWQLPVPNGDILYYVVRIALHSNGEKVNEGNATTTTYTAHGLGMKHIIQVIAGIKIIDASGAGIPYNVSIWAVNLAGAGDSVIITNFTRELSKYFYRSILIFILLFLAPNIAPRNFSAVRLSGSIIEAFWNPLTLSEARGFVTSYTISYRQLTTSSDSGQLEEQQMTTVRNNGTTVTGLQEDASYLVQVWANTAAGAGERSPIVIVQPLSDTTDNLGAIIGGSVSVLFIVALTALAVVSVILLRGRHSKTTE